MVLTKRILVVDDEEEYYHLISLSLKSLGFELFSARNGDEALSKASAVRPGLIFLDLRLGRVNGIEVLRLLRDFEATRFIPIIVMTSFPSEAGIVQSAVRALGAHGFLPKPFTRDGLLKVLSQSLDAPTEEPDVLERGTIRVDTRTRRVWVDGRPVHRLGPRRFDLLCTLLRRPKGASREDLRSELWGRGDDLKTVDLTVHRLRKDLGFPKNRDPIVTVPGGYKLVD